MKDKLEPWKPIVGLPEKMYIEEIHDDDGGFRIILGNNQFLDKILEIRVSENISYRNTDESYMLKLWHTVKKEILGKTFYLVKDSSYIEYFNEMTMNLYVDWKIQHFAIYTDSDCIDILCTDIPTVEWKAR